jgi:hypothetical protein
MHSEDLCQSKIDKEHDKLKEENYREDKKSMNNLMKKRTCGNKK